MSWRVAAFSFRTHSASRLTAAQRRPRMMLFFLDYMLEGNQGKIQTMDSSNRYLRVCQEEWRTRCHPCRCWSSVQPLWFREASCNERSDTDCSIHIVQHEARFKRGRIRTQNAICCCQLAEFFKNQLFELQAFRHRLDDQPSDFNCLAQILSEKGNFSLCSVGSLKCICHGIHMLFDVLPSGSDLSFIQISQVDIVAPS